MLGNETLTPRKMYLYISGGNICHHTKEGTIETYKSIEGTLESIYLKERTFNDEIAPFWYVEIRDSKELYSLSFPHTSPAFNGLILSLASCEELTSSTPIRLEPYTTNRQTRINTYASGKRLSWSKELPPLERKSINGKVITDDTRRKEFIEELVNDIRQKIAS